MCCYFLTIFNMLKEGQKLKKQADKALKKAKTMDKPAVGRAKKRVATPNSAPPGEEHPGDAAGMYT